MAGGYLVLDQQYSGLVIAATSRFYTAIRVGQGSNLIRVKSPQFVDAKWAYNITIEENGNVEASQISLSG